MFIKHRGDDMKEFKIWWKYSLNSFQIILVNRGAFVLLMTGKIIRIGMFLVFLNFLLSGTNGIAGYNRGQIIFLYLSFNLIDTLAQLLYREVFRFRQMVVSGNFDFYLVKPVDARIRAMMGGADLMDLIMLILITIVTVWFAIGNNLVSGPLVWFGYVLMIANGLIIATAFHIFVLGMGILTTSVDHMIMIYRDLTSMVRIPVDLYVEPVRTFLTFVLPIGIMITFPAKIVMGILPVNLIIISFAVGAISLFLANRFWFFALKRYTSASS